MEIYSIFLIIFAATAGTHGASWEAYVETAKVLSQEESLQNLQLPENGKTQLGADFPCEPSKSSEPPNSVHKLRPGDVQVVAALGDSLTTANGARAEYLPGVAIAFLGVSAMIGGDESLDTVVTLPNVLKKYNEEIYGYSTGTGNVNNPESRLNVAVPAAKSHDMPEQAEKLVNRLFNDPNVDVENDWKVVSIFIGGNDVCAWCNEKERYDPEQYVAKIEEAIRILQQIPKVFVNVVGVLNAYQVGNVTRGVVCEVFHWLACDCAMGDNEKIDELKTINKEYQRLLEESVASGQFDNREDFTVVYQPFFIDTDLPTTPDGEADVTYFSPDCFHFSEKAHIAWAIALWNNMIQPVGMKDTEWYPGEELACPSEDSPYLFTNENSKPIPVSSSLREMPFWPDDWFYDTVIWSDETKQDDNIGIIQDRAKYDWEISIRTIDIQSNSSVFLGIGAIFGLIALGLFLVVLVVGLVYIEKRRHMKSQKDKIESVRVTSISGIQ